ncbi:hypothetical protein C8F04DRAFT_1154224 [Mycena alexandri]|uniref:Uncharacterized protein n=1 Tax=Mycena alexandri TaxID=1745969 RepID=A0AAD6WMC3_9AGAR|nr:hypothetical protein C8F04DRAFT_1154224 [Mycena alexandri]
MALESNSALRLECQHVQDGKTAVAEFPTDNPYTAAGCALIAAYEAVELAEEEANKLKAQITTLNDSLARERGRAEELQAKVNAVIKENDVMLRAREADIQTLKNSLAHKEARAAALQGAADKAKAAGEREMQTIKETHSREMDSLRTLSATQQGIFEKIRQQLDQIPHFVPTAFIPAVTQSMILPPSAGQKHPISGNASVFPKRPRTESDPSSTNQPDTSVAKRPRTESSPTTTIASATPSTAPGQSSLGAQPGLAQGQRTAGSARPQPPPSSRSNIGYVAASRTSPRDPRLAPGYKQQASRFYGNRTHQPSYFSRH